MQNKLADTEQFWSTHGKRSILFYYFLTPRLEKIVHQIIWKENMVQTDIDVPHLNFQW